MDRRRIRQTTKDYCGAFVIAAMFALAMALTVWRLKSPEYAALFVALAGFAFIMWWDSYKEAKSDKRGKIAMLSYLRAELIQTRNIIKSITGTVVEKGERGFLPATLHNEAWQAAIASAYFMSLENTLVERLTGIYGRIDVVNHYAGIINTLEYSPPTDEYYWRISVNPARGLYLNVIRALAEQAYEALIQIENHLSKFSPP